MALQKANGIIKTSLIAEYNQKGELYNLDWNSNPKIVTLANFLIQHKLDFRKNYHKKYEETLELFETKIQQDKVARKQKNLGGQSSQFFKPDDSVTQAEDGKGVDNESPIPHL